MQTNLLLMQYVIYTDCEGDKQDAIKGVFQQPFGLGSVTINFLDSPGPKTPISLDELSRTTLHRLETLLKLVTGSVPNQYFATIQRGFFFENGLYHLIAKAAILSPDYIMRSSFTTSIPINEKVSRRKSENKERNMKDLLKEYYPDWNRNTTSVYELLTGEREKMWLQQALRNCLKSLMDKR